MSYIPPFIYNEDVEVDAIAGMARARKTTDKFEDYPDVCYAVQVALPQGFVIGSYVGRPGDYLAISETSRFVIPYEVFEEAYTFE